MAVEIERKFLVERPPDWLDRCDSHRIEQGYLALEADGEVRLRRTDSGRAVLTVKRGRGGTRIEEEMDLDAEAFKRLWPLTEGRRIAKRRYLARRPEAGYEIDVYEGELSGLVIAEVEFSSESERDRFEPPAWVTAELTGDHRYENRSLAAHGRPPR